MDLKINIHSFIDIITNSSSELYVTATNKTLSFVKELLNCYLHTYNTVNRVLSYNFEKNLEVDDVFNISIEKEYPYYSKEIIDNKEYYSDLTEDQKDNYFAIDVINISLKNKYLNNNEMIRMMNSLQGILSSFDAKEITNEI